MTPITSHSHRLLTLTLTLTLTIISPVIVADLYTLQYKGCANSATTASSSALSSLAATLTSHSTTAPFYNATSDDVYGLFQCRGDLSAASCASCVAKALPLWSSLCPGPAAAARVQLSGCYVLYQVAGFPAATATQLLFKNCGSRVGDAADFETKRNGLFSQLQSGISSSGKGFYAASYGGVYGLVQCEGDLGSGDCNDCVTQVVQKAEDECGDAISGQVYLDKCYVSYDYYPNGVPSDSGGHSGGHTTKTVAIVLGGATALGFLIICLLFAKSVMKKKDDF